MSANIKSRYHADSCEPEIKSGKATFEIDGQDFDIHLSSFKDFQLIHKMLIAYHAKELRTVLDNISEKIERLKAEIC